MTAARSRSTRARSRRSAVKARGYWELVWQRFKADRVAIAGGVFIIVLVLAAFVGGPIASRIAGHGPNEIFSNGLDQATLAPVGPWTTISKAPFPTATGTEGFPDTLFILGADGQLGRDMFLRILYGAQTSLEVAVFATIFAVSIGVLLGLLAGYFRGTRRHDRVAPHRDRDGVSRAALHHRHRRHGRASGSTASPSASSRPGCSRSR